ncbi:hypothetical protein BJ742DRAFT_741054 [Cladochytrium replicatum]|nr:hypothetical protein BJ742DRAFT_741054 [Cladochytrium replicatum]
MNARQATIYLRVKRKKTTYFIEIAPTDTVLSLKNRLATVLSPTDPKDMRLLVPTKTQSQQPNSQQQNSQQQYSSLEDSGVLEQLGIVDDQIVYVVLWVSNESNAAEGSWEAVDVPEFEPLNDDGAMEIVEPVDTKGKSRS